MHKINEWRYINFIISIIILLFLLGTYFYYYLLMNESINRSMYFSGDAFFVGASTVMGDLDEDDAPSTPLLLLLVVFLLGCSSESFDEALHD